MAAFGSHEVFPMRSPVKLNENEWAIVPAAIDEGYAGPDERDDENHRHGNARVRGDHRQRNTHIVEKRAKRFQRTAQALTRRAARRRPARDGGGLQLRAFVQNDVHAGVFQLAIKVAQLAFQRIDLRIDLLKLRIQRLQFLAVRRGGDQFVEAVFFQTQRFRRPCAS